MEIAQSNNIRRMGTHLPNERTLYAARILISIRSRIGRERKRKLEKMQQGKDTNDDNDDDRGEEEEEEEDSETKEEKPTAVGEMSTHHSPNTRDSAAENSNKKKKQQ